MIKEREYYQQKYQLPQLVTEILYRNQVSDQHVQQLIQPDEIKELPIPSFLVRILDRVDQAATKKERVVVIGDYDADGICSTTIMVDTLRRLGIEAGFYIPDRLKEGYGLSAETVTQVAEKGYSLIITVDNGVAAMDALDQAKKLGVEVLVTDHHVISGEYDYDYLLHPSLLEERFQTLCGAGIALYLSRCLLDEIIPFHWILAMVATIADMVEVFDENRLIIQKGLEFLNRDGCMVIEKLLDYPQKTIDEVVVGFQLVPKLNAVGRLSDLANVNNVVRYLLSKNPVEVERIATEIKGINQKRKDLTKMAIDSLKEPEQHGCIHVVIEKELHEGILGLIANRVMNEIQEPVLVFTENGTSYKASGRSPKGFDIHAFLKPLAKHCVAFGGHSQACGLEVKKEDMQLFLKALEDNVMKSSDSAESDEKLLELPAVELTIPLVELLNSLKPFGTGLTAPTIQITNFIVDSCTLIKGKYVKWSGVQREEIVEAITFSSAIKYEEVKERSQMNFIGALSINEFRGVKKVNILVDSI